MAKLKKCKDCGHEVSVKARSCPSCGTPKPAKTTGFFGYFFITLVAGLALFTLYNAFSTDDYANPSNAEPSLEAKKLAWIERGKASVKAKLKDPDSAQFKEVFYHKGKDGIHMTCGQVNSKNGMGGYVGYQFFVSAGTREQTYLEEQVDDFRGVWDRFCK